MATVRPNRHSWVTDVWTTLATASGIGYLATAYTVSRWLTRPTPGTPSIPSAAQSDLYWEDVECRAEDGLRLTGWLVSPPEPRGTVALFHGMRGHRGMLLSRIGFLCAAGYRCVAFDHRGHGRSAGRCTSFGFHESRDVTAIAGLIYERWPDQPRAALGISMGAAALCFAAGRAPAWNALILESLYHDLSTAFRNRVGGAYPQWFRRFSRGVVWVTERRLRLRLPDIAPIHYIRNLAPAPVLLLTGSDDAHAPPEDVRQLYATCHEPREFALIAGASHSDICERGGQLYQDLVLSFLSRRLGT